MVGSPPVMHTPSRIELRFFKKDKISFCDIVISGFVSGITRLRL